MKIIKFFKSLFKKTSKPRLNCYSCKHALYGAGSEYCLIAKDQGFGYIDLSSISICYNYEAYETK